MNTKLVTNIAVGLVIIILLIINHNLIDENSSMQEKVSGTKIILNTCPCCESDDACLEIAGNYYYIVCSKCHYKTGGYTNLNELINDWNSTE